MRGGTVLARDTSSPSTADHRVAPLRFAAWSAASLVLAGLIVVLVGLLPVEESDFYDFYLATIDILRNVDAYRLQDNGVQGFFNPLWATFAFIPLAAFDASGAFQVWRVLILLMLAGATLPLARRYRIDLGPGWVAIAGWLFLLPWFVGQNAPLVVVGAFLAIVFAYEERWEVAGAFTPLLLVKPHTVPLLPLVLLAAGRKRFLFGAVASSLIAVVAAVLVQPDWPIAWLTSQWGQSQAAAGQSWPASSLLNALEYLHMPIVLYAVAVGGVCTVLWWRRDESLLTLCALALGLGTAIAPYVRAGDFPLLLPALFVLPTTWARVVALLAAVVFFVPGTPVPLLWSIPGLVAGALVVSQFSDVQGFALLRQQRHD